MKEATQNLIRVFHLNSLTREEANRLNASADGWSSEPRFKRYADITTGFSERFESAVREAWKLGEYHEAADVETDSLDMAYMLTNNISYVWSQNGEVEPLTDEFKSTSVGDIMLKDGEYFLVAPMGFEKLDDLIDIDLTDDEPEITCGACTVAIGAHTNDENCRKEKTTHFFATSCFGYAKSHESREAAIEKLVSRFRVDFKRLIASDRKTGGTAAYVWTCLVNQESFDYSCDMFAGPLDVDWSASKEHKITRATLKVIEFEAIEQGEQS